MSDSRHPPGLWFLHGTGVLARLGRFVVLSSITEKEFLDKLLGRLATTSGDGREFALQAEEDIENQDARYSGTDLVDRPALVVIGPASAGVTVTVSGAAWAEITTRHGAQRIEPGQPSMLLRCVVGSAVIAIHGGLGTERGRTETDWFSRLDGGAVRAGGFTYYPARPRAAPAARAGVSSSWDKPGLATPAYGTELGPSIPPAGASPGSVPATAELGAEESGSASVKAGDAAQPFDALLLVGDRPEAAEARPPLPPVPAHPEAHPGADAPVISGVYCKNGHFDDPQARFCAVCGISMNQLTLVPGPGRRPPLGLLVLDDGAVFQLDTDYVIGRDPGLDAAVAMGKARPLRTVDDAGTVSRVHARVQLDGWLVLVTDLDSTNGTRIRLPGQAADQMLTPRVPTAILPGSRIDLGGRQFRYESHRGRDGRPPIPA